MRDPALWSSLVIGLGGIFVAIFTTRQNRRAAEATNKLEKRVVDRGDFESVMSRMEADLARSDRRIDDLEARLEAEVTAREKAEERAEQAEERAGRAEKRAERGEKRADALERRVTQLEEVLRQHDIPVPPQPSSID